MIRRRLHAIWSLFVAASGELFVGEAGERVRDRRDVRQRRVLRTLANAVVTESP
jgi:hypothetical protein